ILTLGIDFQTPMAKPDFHLPLKRLQAPIFPLKLLADGRNREQSDGIDDEFQIGLGIARVSLSLDKGVSITGQGKSGKAWEVKLKDFPVAFGYELYSGDLDNNGLVDLVLVTYTASNGFLPYSILSIITFDSQGLPVLLRDGLNVEAKMEGIAEIVDLDGDGKAEFIATHYDQEDGKNKWDGYYIADIYKVEDARWHRLRRFGNYSFPVYTHYSPEDKGQYLIRHPERPFLGRRPAAPDLSTAHPVVSGKVLDVSRQKNGFVSFKLGASKRSVVRSFREIWDKCYLNDFVLIIDTKEKRQIRVLPGDEETIDLQTADYKYRNAKLYGNCVPGKLSPNLVWITK
ncbi:MAG: hypothetical protein L0Y75_10980, partial [Acidobacteria bacterium]|nr:hypothetical protein [Acidobacteriota bacterium]